MEFRNATIDDISALVDMRIAFLSEEHPSVTESELSALKHALPGYYRRHLGRDFFACLAVKDGRIVSTVFMVIIERPANLHAITGKHGLILNVYTMPAFRKRGLATALLKKAIADTKHLGLSYVELQATEMGRSVYEKLGFRVKQSKYTCMEYRCDNQDDSSAAKPK